MKKFVVIYHAPMSALEQTMNNTPEESAEGMKAWMKWAETCGDHLVDLGQPLMGGQKLKPDGSSVGSDRQVCGYSVLQAENMDEAKKLMKGHPHLGWDAACAIEVHETMPLPS